MVINQIVSQSSENITEPYNSSFYAMDAVMTLALALNETLAQNPSLNLSLQTAIEAIRFSGVSVIIYTNVHYQHL